MKHLLTLLILCLLLPALPATAQHKLTAPKVATAKKTPAKKRTTTVKKKTTQRKSAAASNNRRNYDYYYGDSAVADTAYWDSAEADTCAAPVTGEILGKISYISYLDETTDNKFIEPIEMPGTVYLDGGTLYFILWPADGEEMFFKFICDDRLTGTIPEELAYECKDVNGASCTLVINFSEDGEICFVAKYEDSALAFFCQ